MKYWADVNSAALNMTEPGTQLTPRFWDLGITSFTGMPNNANIGPQKQSKSSNTGGNASKNASKSGNQTKSNGSKKGSSTKGSNEIAASNTLNLPGVGNVSTTFSRDTSPIDSAIPRENNMATDMYPLNMASTRAANQKDLALALWPVNKCKIG
jgi:hypothetical protein